MDRVKYAFGDMFMKSNGKPIQFEGKTLIMCDHLPVAVGESRIRYAIVSTSSEWRQGIALATKGKLVFWDEQVHTRGWADLWEDKVDHRGEFTCYSKDGILDAKNIWDTGNGVVESWTNGAAMWIGEIPGGRRYHCNDGHFDDDFDDIVFELVIVDEEAGKG